MNFTFIQNQKFAAPQYCPRKGDNLTLAHWNITTPGCDIAVKDQSGLVSAILYREQPSRS